MTTAEELQEAFKIFDKYTDDDYLLHAEHDEIRVSVNPEDVSEEDKERLDELGFHDGSHHHVPDFYYFT